MKHSNNNEHAQKLAENNKNNLLIKTDKEDFKKAKYKFERSQQVQKDISKKGERRQ